jgi:hypothetical protein
MKKNIYTLIVLGEINRNSYSNSISGLHPKRSNKNPDLNIGITFNPRLLSLNRFDSAKKIQINSDKIKQY